MKYCGQPTGGESAEGKERRPEHSSLTKKRLRLKLLNKKREKRNQEATALAGPPNWRVSVVKARRQHFQNTSFTETHMWKKYDHTARTSQNSLEGEQKNISRQDRRLSPLGLVFIAGFYFGSFPSKGYIHQV